MTALVCSRHKLSASGDSSVLRGGCSLCPHSLTHRMAVRHVKCFTPRLAPCSQTPATRIRSVMGSSAILPTGAPKPPVSPYSPRCPPGSSRVAHVSIWVGRVRTGGGGGISGHLLQRAVSTPSRRGRDERRRGVGEAES